MITLCPEDRAKEIMNSPDVRRRVGRKTDDFRLQPWRVTQQGADMMFVFFEVAEGTYEMHIAAERGAIRQSRKLCREAIEWLYQMGAETIVTTCPKSEPKIANFIEKLGGIPVAETNDEIHYEHMR